MMKLIKINVSFYFYAILLILTGYINYLLIFAIIIFFHELGHIICIKLFGYQINKLTVYPCGAIMDTNIPLNIKSSRLFIISIAGITMQVLLFIIIKPSIGYNYVIFKQLNTIFLIFNLLPIYPLDGYKISISFLETIYPYKKVIYASIKISFVALILFIVSTKNILLFIILIFLNIHYYRHRQYIINKFLLERHLYPHQQKKCKYINSLDYIYKCRKNYIKYLGIYYDELDIIKKKFSQFY